MLIERMPNNITYLPIQGCISFSYEVLGNSMCAYLGLFHSDLQNPSVSNPAGNVGNCEAHDVRSPQEAATWEINKYCKYF